MTSFQLLVLLWTLLFAHIREARGEVLFLERREGESAALPCEVEPSARPPFGVYLKRSWRSPAEVLFMYSGSDFTVARDEDRARIAVSGDPASLALNVSLSQLRAADTDRYSCEFVVENPSSEDLRLPGKTDFFLLVVGGGGGGDTGGGGADAPGPEDMSLVETCAGGSAVLPCLPPGLGGDALAVEGVSLARRRGRAPVEVLYHSRRRHGGASPSSQLPDERFQLTSAPGPNGISYNLTLLGLQSDDSGAYSCQLLLRGRADGGGSGGLGRRVSFVSVRGAGECGCTGRSTLLYVLSSAVAALLLLLLLLAAVHCASRRRAVAHPQAPIYEEMAGVKPSRHGLNAGLLDQKEDSEYKNCPSKKSCPENYYETPRSALSAQRGSQE